VTSSSSWSGLTDLDRAIRALIAKLKPLNLTKAEVLMIVNLGIGLDAQQEPGKEHGDVTMADDEAESRREEGEDNREEADYGARALLDTVIEDREERLSPEDVGEILRIVRDTLGRKDLSDAG
jgi:hypothetical protein